MGNLQCYLRLLAGVVGPNRTRALAQLFCAYRDRKITLERFQAELRQLASHAELGAACWLLAIRTVVEARCTQERTVCKRYFGERGCSILARRRTRRER